ncbi:MAG: hypothetical protein M3281_02380, partial [Chloroflexota bacterium]|nr:hypothetical protein [Chloroflexota bacterium]
PVGVQALIIASAVVEPAGALSHATVGEVEATTEARVLLLTSGDSEQWRPSPDVRLCPGDHLIVVATRRGLAQIFEAADAPHMA